MVLSWHAEWAWLGDPARGVEADVLLQVAHKGDTFSRVAAGVPAPPGAKRLPGLTIPGLVNGHSHAFHRALRGRTHRGSGDFWTWRQQMYTVAERLDPDRYEALAEACYAEMILAGITTVGEFHYLHHGPGGQPYADRNVMAEALHNAAGEAGIRLTLLDTLYLRAGFGDTDGSGLDPVQQRFSDGDAERWAERVVALRSAWGGLRMARVGVAAHSVRAVDPVSAKTVADLAQTRGGWPAHVHLSEQPAENQACQEVHGRTPTELLDEAGFWGWWSTAVHATHVTGTDLGLLAGGGATVCLCPTTERDLADGIGPARRMVALGIPLSLGSDSHAVIDLFEEARAVELDERLASGTRGDLNAAALLAAAVGHGAASLGWPAGRLAKGQLADFVTLGLDSVRLAGVPAGDDLVPGVVFAATGADVRHVVVGGRTVVDEGRHLAVPDVPGALRRAVEAVA